MVRLRHVDRSSPYGVDAAGCSHLLRAILPRRRSRCPLMHPPRHRATGTTGHQQSYRLRVVR